MTAVWVCAHREGDPTYHDTEQAAEKTAAELVKSKRATQAVVYAIEIQETA